MIPRRRSATSWPGLPGRPGARRDGSSEPTFSSSARSRSRGQRGGVARVVRVGFLHPAAGALLDGAAGRVVLNSRGGRSMRRTLPLALVLLVGPSLARPLPAQETASDSLLTVNHYLYWAQVADPQISPDGAQIVYTRRWVNKLEDKWESALWIMNVDGSHNRFLVKGSDARWSPDGTRILYLADGEPKGTQLFVRWMDAEGASSQVTRVLEKPTNPRWAPDGKSIAFVMLVPDSTLWTISLPKPPEGAKWTPAPRVVDDLHYRQDRVGYMEQGFTHLFLVSADGGTARALTSGRWHVGARFDGLTFGAGYDWTPDGRTIVFDGLRDSTWDRQYQVSRVYALDVASGTIKALVSRPGFWANPVVSPDGRSVAFSGNDSTEHTHRTSDLWVMGIDGSGVRDVSKSFDRDPGELHWAPDGKGVFFHAGDRGAINVHYADLAGAVRDVTQGAQVVSLASLARTLVGVGVAGDAEHAGDVVRMDLRRPGPVTRLTAVNDDVLANKRLAKMEGIGTTRPAAPACRDGSSSRRRSRPRRSTR